MLSQLFCMQQGILQSILCKLTLIERFDFFYNIGHVGYIVLQPIDDIENNTQDVQIWVTVPKTSRAFRGHMNYLD